MVKVDWGDSDSLSRDELLSTLRTVIDMCFKKVNYVNCSNSDKAAFMRIINSAVSSATPLLRDTKLEELRSEVELIKKHLSEGRPVSILVNK